MSWPLLRAGGRRGGRRRQAEEWFDQHVAKIRDRRQSAIAAYVTDDGTVYVAADFSPCGCGAMVWTRERDGTITVTKTEQITCAEHEGEPR